VKITINKREEEVKLQSPIKWQPPIKRTVPRKPRADKRVRSTLRISREMDEWIKTIAFNHSTSKQKVVDKIINMVLESDVLRSRLTNSMPKQQRHPYLFMGD